jgi:hypothetical protein
MSNAEPLVARTASDTGDSASLFELTQPALLSVSDKTGIVELRPRARTRWISSSCPREAPTACCMTRASPYVRSATTPASRR